MSEQEVETLVLEAIRNAIELITFPEGVWVEDRGEDIDVKINVQTEKSGSLDVKYNPISSVKYFVNCADLLLARIGKDKPNELNQEFRKQYVHSLTHSLLRQFHKTVLDFHSSLYELAFATLREYMEYSAPQKSEQSEDTIAPLDQWFQDRSKNIRSVARSIGEVKLRTAKHLIAHFYDLFLPQWKEAKAFYKRNKKLENWAELVVITYELIDIDLLSRLFDPDPYLSMPSSIALEQAARMCGFQCDSLSRRTLNTYLRESRKWIETNGEDLKKAEVDKFFGNIAEDVGYTLWIAKLAGSNEPEEWDSPAHEYVKELMLSEPETVHQPDD